MHRKSDLFASFDNFQKYIQCQYHAKICIFQSDEGGEFADAFIKNLAHFGIHHQSSCPKTLEQNGTAERKHRNISELGLTLMFHANVLPRF